MKSESLKQILAFLTRILEKNDFNEDKQIIQYLFKELEKLEQQLPTDNKLEELQSKTICKEYSKSQQEKNDVIMIIDENEKDCQKETKLLSILNNIGVNIYGL